MRNSSILLAGVAALLCVDVALAQSVAPNTGFYLGASLGKSHARFKTSDFSSGDPTISESANTTDTGYKAFVGWAFSRYIATELSYTSIGRYSYSYTAPGFGTSKVHYDANAVALSALGTIPIGRDFSALLRLGVSANKAERSELTGAFGTAPPVGATQKTRASPMGGIGLQYDLASNAALRLEFEYYGLFGDEKGSGIQATPTANFPDTTGRANIWMFSIGAVARF
jgi:opacity protein-like surface antigen